MSGFLNGRQLVNGTGFGEHGERVLVRREDDEPEEEKEPIRGANDIKLMALAKLSGYEKRSYRKIAEGLGCSASAVSKAVQKIARRLGVRTEREEKKAAYARAQRGHRYYGQGPRRRKPPGVATPPAAGLSQTQTQPQTQPLA